MIVLIYISLLVVWKVIVITAPFVPVVIAPEESFDPSPLNDITYNPAEKGFDALFGVGGVTVISAAQTLPTEHNNPSRTKVKICFLMLFVVLVIIVKIVYLFLIVVARSERGSAFTGGPLSQT